MPYVGCCERLFRFPDRNLKPHLAQSDRQNRKPSQIASAERKILAKKEAAHVCVRPKFREETPNKGTRRRTALPDQYVMLHRKNQ